MAANNFLIRYGKFSGLSYSGGVVLSRQGDFEGKGPQSRLFISANSYEVNSI